MGAARKRARDGEAAAAGPAWLQAPRSSGQGHVRIWSVPYSEHSSFAELQEFMRWLRPVAVVPTVGRGDGGGKVAAMLRALAT